MQDMNIIQNSPLLQLFRKRRSVRLYLEKTVEREKILTCIEAARLAPSAHNVQPWRFLVIDDPEIKNKFANEVFSGIYSITKFAAKAPVLIMQLARKDLFANTLGKQIQNIHFYLIDSGIGGEHLVLQASELELGTCWIGWFNVKRARKFFKIPKKYKIISLLSMGYFEQKEIKEKKRKGLEELVWFNHADF